MSRPLLSLSSGVFILLQLALSSAGVWADAKAELAALATDVHVESSTESCVEPHDHRLCVICRGALGLAAAGPTLPGDPVPVLDGVEAPLRLTFETSEPAALPPARAPPVLA